MLLFLNIGWKLRQLIFISFPQSLKYASYPAWGRVHITKSNEVLVIIYSKTGCSLRPTGNIYCTMHFGPSVSQEAMCRTLLPFSTETKQPVKDRCFRNSPCEVTRPGNPHCFCALKQMCTSCKWFHYNTVKWEFWCWLNTKHCRYWHKDSVWLLMTEDCVFVHSCLTPTVLCTEANSILSNFLWLYNTLYSKVLQCSLLWQKNNSQPILR